MRNNIVITYGKENTERERTISRPNRLQENNSGDNQKKSINKCLKAFIIVSAIVIIIAIGVIIYKLIGKKSGGDGNGQPNIPSDNQNPLHENIKNDDDNTGTYALSKKEALKAFKPNLKSQQKQTI